MNGNSVSAGTNSNSFDFGSFMRELMGQLSSVLTESIRKAYDSNNQQNVSEKSNGVSIDKSILDSINTFTNRLKSVADILAGLNSIPAEIRITGQHDVNVIINGDKCTVYKNDKWKKINRDALVTDLYYDGINSIDVIYEEAVDNNKTIAVKDNDIDFLKYDYEDGNTMEINKEKLDEFLSKNRIVNKINKLNRHLLL
jgi:hypothetical protein